MSRNSYFSKCLYGCGQAIVSSPCSWEIIVKWYMLCSFSMCLISRILYAWLLHCLNNSEKKNSVKESPWWICPSIKFIYFKRTYSICIKCNSHDLKTRILSIKVFKNFRPPPFKISVWPSCNKSSIISFTELNKKHLWIRNLLWKTFLLIAIKFDYFVKWATLLSFCSSHTGSMEQLCSF